MSTTGIEPLPGRRPVYPVDPAKPPLPPQPEPGDDPASDANTEPANHPNDDE